MTGTQWEFTEFRSSFPWAPLIKTKSKHTKRKRRFLEKKNKSPTLHLEARVSFVQVREAAALGFWLLQHFLLFKCPSSGHGISSIGPTHCYCLKQRVSLPVVQAAPLSQAKADLKCFELQGFLSKLSSTILPHSQTDEYADIYNPPNHAYEYAFCSLILISGHCS